MIVIDFSPIVFRNLFMNIKLIQESNYKGLPHFIFYSLIKIRKQFSDYDEFVLAIDSKNTWRHQYFEQNVSDIYPDIKYNKYKGHRERQDDINWNKVFEITDDTIDILSKYTDFKVIKVEQTEADDIIYVICNEMSKINKNVIIVSSDKDFIQLLRLPNVKLFDPMKNIYKSGDGSLYLRKQILIGDKSDNIPAVKKRLGEKTALKMLPDVGKLLKIDKEFKKRYEFNKKLIDLTEIPDNLYQQIKQQINSVKNGKYNQQQLISFCNKYKLKKVLEDLSEFRFKKQQKGLSGF